VGCRLATRDKDNGMYVDKSVWLRTRFHRGITGPWKSVFMYYRL
jgi:hypothetical protein